MQTIKGPGPGQRAGARLAAVLATVWAVLMLAACGPGVGGSGTGETQSALETFGASATSVCGGELAPLLSCPPGSSTSAPAPGSTPVYLADTIDGRRVLVTVRGNTLELAAPCARLQFRGEWGAIGSQAGRFYGYTEPDTVPAPASVQVQATGGGVLLTVRDATGTTLLGPVLVTVVPTGGVPGVCG